jgi:hypothetical protein
LKKDYTKKYEMGKKSSIAQARASWPTVGADRASLLGTGAVHSLAGAQAPSAWTASPREIQHSPASEERAAAAPQVPASPLQIISFSSGTMKKSNARQGENP